MAQSYLGSSKSSLQYLGTTTINKTYQPDFLVATGGTITFDGDFKIHTFTDTGSFTFNVIQTSSIAANNSVEYLVVGGGGGGGTRNSTFPFNQRGGGGGGAGGFLTGFNTVTSVGPYTGSVGVGGTKSTTDDLPNPSLGTDGGNSVIFGYTAFGGGRGSNSSTGCIPANPGGSGGGGYVRTDFTCVSNNVGGAGVSGQGNKGGDNVGNNPGDGGGGGGGAGAVGGNAAQGFPGGNGGDGLGFDISGTFT